MLVLHLCFQLGPPLQVIRSPSVPFEGLCSLCRRCARASVLPFKVQRTDPHYLRIAYARKSASKEDEVVELAMDKLAVNLGVVRYLRFVEIMIQSELCQFADCCMGLL